MKIRNLEFSGDTENPSWFAIIDEPGFKSHLYISAGEDGPDERQYEIMDRFLELREPLLEDAKFRTLSENTKKKIKDESFSLGAVFIHSKDENYEIDLAGSLKEKKFFSSSDIPWNFTIDSSTYKLKN